MGPCWAPGRGKRAETEDARPEGTMWALAVIALVQSAASNGSRHPTGCTASRSCASHCNLTHWSFTENLRCVLVTKA